MVTSIDDDSTQSKRYFAFRDQMLGEMRIVPATEEQLRAAGNLIYGHESLFSLYGISATELAASNFTILGRTVIESCVDAHVNSLCLRLGEILSTQLKGPDTYVEAAVYDLFCGSGNISYRLGRHLDRPVFASDLDPSVYKATQHNLALLRETAKSSTGFAFNLSLTDYRNLLNDAPPTRHPTDIYIIEPPWEDAFTHDGLDLTRTSPPVQDIVADIQRSRAGVPCYIALKTLDRLAPGSLKAAMTGARPVEVVQCLPRSFRIDFHIYIVQ